MRFLFGSKNFPKQTREQKMKGKLQEKHFETEFKEGKTFTGETPKCK